MGGALCVGAKETVIHDGNREPSASQPVPQVLSTSDSVHDTFIKQRTSIPAISEVKSSTVHQRFVNVK